MKNNVMIDLETLGLKNDAVILSIGAVYFDETGIDLNNTFYREINIQSCIDLGLTIDGDTISWWMQQSEKARKVFDNKKIKTHINQAIDDLVSFLKRYGNQKDLKIWSNGYMDIIWLRSAFQKTIRDLPWSKNERDFRTFRDTQPKLEDHELPKEATKHNALADAIWQAEYTIKIMQKKGE